MNGKDKTFFNNFFSRFLQLETKFEGFFDNTEKRWDRHDKRSDGIWREIKSDLKNIHKKLDNFQRLKSDVVFLNWAVKLMIAAMVGGFFWMLRK